MIPRKALIPFLAFLALVALPAAAQAAGKKAIWGPVIFPSGNLNCPTSAPCSALPTYARAGVDTFQIQILWDRVAPTPPANPRNPADPAYQWPRDGDIASLQGAAFGIEIAALVQRAPNWANGGRGPFHAPFLDRAYADFIYAASLRYPLIRKWIVWGEPNRAAVFQPNGVPFGPRRYSTLLDAAYGALKAANRANVVIGASTVSAGEVEPPRFIKNLRINGRMPRMDLYAHNPFDNRFPRLKDRPAGLIRGLNDVDTLWKEVKRAWYGKPKKKKRAKKAATVSKKKKRKKKKGKPKGLFLSEWLVPTSPAKVFADPFFVSRPEQARRITAAYRMINRLKYVKALGYFTLLDQPPGPLSNEWGLMEHNGLHKPGFYAYSAAR